MISNSLISSREPPFVMSRIVPGGNMYQTGVVPLCSATGAMSLMLRTSICLSSSCLRENLDGPRDCGQVAAFVVFRIAQTLDVIEGDPVRRDREWSPVPGAPLQDERILRPEVEGVQASQVVRRGEAGPGRGDNHEGVIVQDHDRLRVRHV